MNVEQIHAEYIDHMGSDLSVVNAARTSFGKESEWVWDGIGQGAEHRKNPCAGDRRA